MLTISAKDFLNNRESAKLKNIKNQYQKDLLRKAELNKDNDDWFDSLNDNDKDFLMNYKGEF